jgi:8-oxo-dGTP diphosphatase
MHDNQKIYVAAAAITNDRNEVFIARRPEHVHQGGLWEFPGGKVEPGETVREALQRELHEEIGIDVLSARPLIRLHYDYPDKSVLLDVWLVRQFGGTPHGREGQPVQWVPRMELQDYDFPAANQPIITALQLPDKYLITPSPRDGSEHFLARLEKSLQNGISLVQLRAPELSDASYAGLAGKVLSLCQQYDAQLVLNSDPVWVERLGAHGVHLNSRRLMTCTARPLAKDFWVGASCHNTAEIEQANSINADFAVLAPVLPTQSHPQAATLGWEPFRQLTDMANLPVYALGGMSVQHLAVAHEHGAQGIAAIRSLWSDSLSQE